MNILKKIKLIFEKKQCDVENTSKSFMERKGEFEMENEKKEEMKEEIIKEPIKGQEENAEAKNEE